MFRSSLVLALGAALAFVPAAVADDAALKIDFKVEGVSPKTVDTVKNALAAIDGVGEVMTGADGVYQVSIEKGKSVDLNAIAKAVAGAKSADGPDLRLDIKSLMLSGMFMVSLDGSTDTAAAIKAISSTEGFAAEAGKAPGTLSVKVTSSKPKSAMDLIQALGQAKLKLGNITWAAGEAGHGEGCGEGGCGEGGCGGGGCGGGGR